MRPFRISILCLVLALALTSCGRRAPLENVHDAPFNTQQNAQLVEIRDAIIDAGRQRGWILMPQGAGVIRGGILVRNKHKVDVEILYDVEKFSIIYLSSKNMNYEERDGKPYIHPNYISWINNLKQDIQVRTTNL